MLTSNWLVYRATPLFPYVYVIYAQWYNQNEPEATITNQTESAVSVVVWFRTESGKLCTKVTNVDGSNFAAENGNILYVDNDI